MHRDSYLRLSPEDDAALERVMAARGLNKSSTLRELIREADRALGGADGVRTTSGGKRAPKSKFAADWERNNPGKKWEDQ